MSIKTYRIYCEICGYNRITDGSSEEDKNMQEIKRSPIQKNIPVLGEDGKIVPSSNIKQPKMFKCPTCGRGIRARKIINAKQEDNSD